MHFACIYNIHFFPSYFIEPCVGEDFPSGGKREETSDLKGRNLKKTKK